MMNVRGFTFDKKSLWEERFEWFFLMDAATRQITPFYFKSHHCDLTLTVGFSSP
jgi:hypothetical protein